MNLSDRYEFRNIKIDEIDEAVAIEHTCFPPNEACSKEHMTERAMNAPELFLVAIDKEDGKMAAIMNGLSTDEEVFRDEFFTDIDLYDPDGRYVMILGLAVLPKHRGQGLAREMVSQYVKISKKQERDKLILTCLDSRIPMYEKFGFADYGMANSIWGGEKWHEMGIEVN